LRALAVAANDYLTRHGAPREASGCLEELLAVAERHGSLPSQAEALTELVLAVSDLGRFADARARAEQARAALDRLGPDHRLQSWRTWLDVSLVHCLDGSWPAVAADVEAWLDPTRPHASAGALLSAATAALAYARLGQDGRTRNYLATL